MKNIFGLGNALVDALVKVHDEAFLQQLGLQKGAMQLVDNEGFQNISKITSASHCELCTGGSAANVMLCAARLGEKSVFCGKPGQDANSAFFRQEMMRNGVSVVPLSGSLPMGVASTFITPDGQRTFATYLGAGGTLSASELQPAWFEGAGYAFIEGYLVQDHALIETAISMARSAGAKVCIDLASYNIVADNRSYFRHLLEDADVVLANEEESHALTGLAPAAALDALAAICPVAVVKVGAKGAMARRGQEYVRVEAVKVPGVVDTTAAGDFFAAGFLVASLRGASLADALRLGARCSAEVIQVVGTRLSEAAWSRLRLFAAGSSSARQALS